MLKNVLKRIFLVDLLKGMWVTFYYQHPKNIYTEQYPLERPMVAERYRRAPRLNTNPETGETLCIACNLCALACPIDLIEVQRERDRVCHVRCRRNPLGVGRWGSDQDRGAGITIVGR